MVGYISGFFAWIWNPFLCKQNFKKQPSIIFFLSLKYRFEFWAKVCSFCVQRLMLRPGFIYLVNIMPECINWCLKAFTNVPIVCQSITFYGVWGPQPLKKKLVVPASFAEISLNTWHYQVSDSWYNILRVIRSMNLCSDGCLIKNCGSFEVHAWIILRLKCGFIPKWTLTANLERGKTLY